MLSLPVRRSLSSNTCTAFTKLKATYGHLLALVFATSAYYATAEHLFDLCRILQLTTLYYPFDRTYCPKMEHVLGLYRQNESRRATVFVRYNNNPRSHCRTRICTVRGAAAQSSCGISPFICIATKYRRAHARICLRFIPTSLGNLAVNSVASARFGGGKSSPDR